MVLLEVPAVVRVMVGDFLGEEEGAMVGAVKLAAPAAVRVALAETAVVEAAKGLVVD